ncbi:MAG: DUF362 domain-containing protein [Candidatus Bathyarchaeota archaeon]|nr:DUF362 domain-containing protein [Candidatus Bathyarchaeota archaeon]
MKPSVSIARVEDGVEEAVKEAIELLGGIDRFVKPGGTYLVKPNLFTTKSAELGVTTDPRIMMALSETLRGAGAKPVVGECPATASYTRPDIVFDGLGVRALCEEAGVEIRVLDREAPVRVENPGAEVVKELWFPETALGCDGIVNVPKLKTHNLTSLTCAVKNLFGLQQGGTKAHHHVRTANDPERFSRLLIDIYESIRGQIRLNVVDADVAMEGEGPTTGDPVDLGLIIAGEDAAAVDLVATAVMGWDPMEVGTNFIAAERGLGPGSLDDVQLVGAPIEDVVRPFKRPLTHSDGQMFIDIRMPIEWYEDKCTGCGICAKVCPGQAITMHEGPYIDDGCCIQCFCCMELCPSGALRAIRPDE